MLSLEIRRLEAQVLRGGPLIEVMSGLYIHIPFCERKCSYCAFYSLPKPWKNVEAFLDSLGIELKNLKRRYPAFLPETVFVGGGTPNALTALQLESVLTSVAQAVDLSRVQEFSCEVNPGILDSDQLATLRVGGVNRLSIGVQSFDAYCLKILGRIHSAEQAEEAFRMARATGFENISLDLMFGVPGQTITMLEADLDRLRTLNPEHVAVYNLMVEEGTPIAERTDWLEEGLEREMYDLIRSRLGDAGFVQYEISNFAKPGFECRHNQLYWNGGEYLGCGPSAHSHWNGTRWGTMADLDGYCLNSSKAILDPLDSVAGSPVLGGASLAERAESWPQREFEETLGPAAKERETLVMGLRQLAGVEVSAALWEAKQSLFRRLENAGLLRVDGRRVRLTEAALFVSDAVFSELV